MTHLAAAVWSVGFLVCVIGMIATNIMSYDPDEHWPPQAVILAAMWPLLLVLLLVGLGA